MLRIFALALTLAAAPALAGQGQAITGPLRVIDGDTFAIGATRIRLTGIDAPEQDQTCLTAKGQPFACGAWVSSQVAAQFDGRTARCDSEGTDRYGRTLARCTVKGHDIGEALVGQGLAFAYRRYSRDYIHTEDQAKHARAGLWSMRVSSPADWRAARRLDAAQTPPSPACAIKGNISQRGTRIYHLPHQAYYALTRISRAKGERWFCSEAAARAAGWRKSRS